MEKKAYFTVLRLFCAFVYVDIFRVEEWSSIYTLRLSETGDADLSVAVCFLKDKIYVESLTKKIHMFNLINMPNNVNDSVPFNLKRDD